VNAFAADLVALAGLAGAPLLVGIVNRFKAWLGGRRGAPLAQPYREIFKLLRRGVVYSHTTTWVFSLGAPLGLVTTVLAFLIIPAGGLGAPLRFGGDLIVAAGLLALGRFATVLGALDTGSSFEGMGASREAHLGALAEPVLFLALAVLVRLAGETSLSGVLAGIRPELWTTATPALALVAATVLIVALVECARVPVDDPTTHLELTMIHEVMVLDHSGPDLAFIQYAAALKLWLLGLLLAGIVFPVREAGVLVEAGVLAGGMLVFGLLVGAIESLTARWRLLAVPNLIVAAGALAAVAFLTTL